MDGTIETGRASIWLEGFRLFAANWREWIKYAVVFFILLTIIQILAYDPAIQAMTQKISALKAANQKPTAEDVNALTHAALHNVWALVIIFILTFAQNFFYTVIFLKNPPVIASPEISVGRFFFALGQGILVTLFYLGLVLIFVGAPVSLVKVSPAFGLLAILGFGFAYYLVLRFFLVIPIAVTGMKRTFKTSWDMTRGNWWRILGNGVLFGVALIIMMIIVHVVERTIVQGLLMANPTVFGTVTDAPPAANPFVEVVRMFALVPPGLQGGIGVYVGMAFNMLNICLWGGLGKAFQCAMLRVLYQEQQIP